MLFSSLESLKTLGFIEEVKVIQERPKINRNTDIVQFADALNSAAVEMRQNVKKELGESGTGIIDAGSGFSKYRNKTIYWKLEGRKVDDIVTVSVHQAMGLIIVHKIGCDHRAPRSSVEWCTGQRSPEPDRATIDSQAKDDTIEEQS